MRREPEHKRKRYAMTVSACITGIIFLFWLVSFTLNKDVVVSKVKSPISALTASVGEAFKYSKEMIFGANKTEYSSDNIEVVPGRN